ncbi:hypothetical protein P280DRAFT_415937 [Massarina eburnea CBS 473.64]|uniref:Uncharacterized protein n=1 Tax=Massarina eburnea CBS 473.64 TaxID=1395130 RepID=A0A6A6SIQ9_9PLEO|nr:hypothetical protein P280DRAFT_415937 [Massarina eburnea CBS 473.64]
MASLKEGDIQVAVTTITNPASPTETRTYTFYTANSAPNAFLYATTGTAPALTISPNTWLQDTWVAYSWEPSKNAFWPKDGPFAATSPLSALNTIALTSGGISTSAASITSAVTNPSGTTSPPPANGSSTSSTSSIPSSTSSIPSSTSPTPSSTGKMDPKKNGLGTGAVVGVAIGCLIAGALIAGLLAFCFMKRKKPKSARDSEASALALMYQEKGPAVKAVSVPFAMEGGIPQPLEDKAVSGEISKISNLIKNHVQSYYHSKSVNPGLIDYDDIQALGDDLPVSVGTLTTLLGNAATREPALRFCIAWVITSRIQLHDSPTTTFLPHEISECLRSMSPLDRGSKVHAMYFAKWRVITAELIRSTYVRTPFSAKDSRVHNIQAAASLLGNVLRPYSDSRMDEKERSRNLEEILKRAAQFAFTLFSQPAGYDFDWENEQDVQSGSICIFPALVQISDDNGGFIKPPRLFSEAVVRRLDG